MFATFFLLLFAFANFHCQLERGDLYKKHRLTTIYNLRSMKYHGSSLWISLSIFAYHNLIHFSEPNLKPISLTNIDSLYPVSMCFIFFVKNQSLRLQWPRATNEEGAFSRFVYLC